MEGREKTREEGRGGKERAEEREREEREREETEGGGKDKTSL